MVKESQAVEPIMLDNPTETPKEVGRFRILKELPKVKLPGINTVDVSKKDIAKAKVEVERAYDDNLTDDPEQLAAEDDRLSNGIKAYLVYISRYPLLTAEEEMELATRYRK